MKALIVTNIKDEFLDENHPLYKEARDVIVNINKLLLKFDIIFFIINDSENACESKIHTSLQIEKCKKDFYIFKKEEDNNIFANEEVRDLLNEKNVNSIYICGFELENDVKDISIFSYRAGYKTVVFEDATLALEKDINKILKIFKEYEIYFIDTWELEELENN